MTALTLTTFDWVPEKPRGFVRDLRVRWALEEAGLPYRIATVPFGDRSADHLAHQPFGQVPWLTDGEANARSFQDSHPELVAGSMPASGAAHGEERLLNRGQHDGEEHAHGAISVFESGAILLHLGERSSALMPGDPRGRMAVVEWLFAALNSVEMAALPWALARLAGAEPGERLDAFLAVRLQRLEPVLEGRAWLAGAFSIADIAMADVLRLVDRFDGLAAAPACRAYVGRATDRVAFRKAYADQLAHFAAADRAMAGNQGSGSDAVA